MSFTAILMSVVRAITCLSKAGAMSRVFNFASGIVASDSLWDLCGVCMSYLCGLLPAIADHTLIIRVLFRHTLATATFDYHYNSA